MEIRPWVAVRERLPPPRARMTRKRLEVSDRPPPGHPGHLARMISRPVWWIPVPKVLIVGSADLGTDLERTILWADGVERALVSTPGGALEVARAFVPSVVVVDGADAPAALGLLRRLRENAGTRRSSIVVVSRQTGVPEEELRQAGANLVLTGPVDPPLWNVERAVLFGWELPV